MRLNNMQYKVISPLQTEGRRWEVGELIDLKDSEAFNLLKLGAIEQALLPFQIPKELKFSIKVGG